MFEYRQAIRVAILDADIPVPAVRSVKGLYSDIFADILQSAVKERLYSSIFSFESYDVVAGQYPLDLDSIDGIIITGSCTKTKYERQTLSHVFQLHPHTINIPGSSN